MTPERLTPERLEEIRRKSNYSRTAHIKTQIEPPAILDDLDELLAEVDRLTKVVDAARSYARSGGSTLAAKDIMAAVKDYQQETGLD